MRADLLTITPKHVGGTEDIPNEIAIQTCQKAFPSTITNNRSADSTNIKNRLGVNVRTYNTANIVFSCYGWRSFSLAFVPTIRFLSLFFFFFFFFFFFLNMVFSRCAVICAPMLSSYRLVAIAVKSMRRERGKCNERCWFALRLLNLKRFTAARGSDAPLSRPVRDTKPSWLEFSFYQLNRTLHAR